MPIFAWYLNIKKNIGSEKQELEALSSLMYAKIIGSVLFSFIQVCKDPLPAISLLCRGIDGHKITSNQRSPEYIYGELRWPSDYASILSQSRHIHNQNAKFCDLGCGLGKALLVVSGYFRIKNSIGIEFIKELCEIAKIRTVLFEEILSAEKVRILNMNFLDHPEVWLDSDVIFMNSVTWTRGCLGKLVNLFKKLKEGSEIISSTRLNSKYLKLWLSCEASTSWGRCEFFYYTVVK